MEPFTEFVDKNFKPGTLNVSGNEAKQALLTKKDLEHLLASNDRKGMKTALRTNQWPADHEIRKFLWKNLCQHLHKDRGNIYHDMLLEVFGEGDKNVMVSLPQFVDPANMHSYHLSEKGTHTVKRIICILGNTNPDITYGPAIFPLCSLFLHYLEEEDCFNCVYTILRHRIGYMVQTKIAFEATKHVLKELVKKYAKGPHSFISKQGLVIEGVLDNWLWWILSDLPFSYRVKVIDCFILEGPKVLYRVALAILILFHKQSVKNNTRYVQGDITAAISDFCEEIPVTINKLLKVAFGIRGLSRKEIRKLTVQKEMYVKSIRNVSNTQLPHMSKSASCDSLHLKVSRSFNGPANDGDSIFQNGGKTRERSFSHGMAHFTKVVSTVLSINHWHSIWNWLPTRISLYHPELVYTTSEDGTSLATFFNRVEEREPVLIVVRTVKGEIFGAYCSTDWGERNRLKNSKSFFGTGESFLFTLNPKEQKFEWVGIKMGNDTPYSANMFQASDNQMLTVGGGGGGSGFKLDENLSLGWSTRCDTFNNELLAEGGEFECAVVEAFVFTDK